MEVPPFKIEKSKIAKGRSYILKTSLLQNAVSAASLTIPIHLIYWTPQIDGSVLQALFWPPSENCAHSRLYVRAGSLPSEVRRSALEQLAAQRNTGIHCLGFCTGCAACTVSDVVCRTIFCC